MSNRGHSFKDAAIQNHPARLPRKRPEIMFMYDGWMNRQLSRALNTTKEKKRENTVKGVMQARGRSNWDEEPAYHRPRRVYNTCDPMSRPKKTGLILKDPKPKNKERIIMENSVLCFVKDVMRSWIMHASFIQDFVIWTSFPFPTNSGKG